MKESIEKLLEGLAFFTRWRRSWRSTGAALLFCAAGLLALGAEEAAAEAEDFIQTIIKKFKEETKHE